MLALGEVLLRLSPEGNERLTQGTDLRNSWRAELNVAVGAATWGLLQVLSPRSISCHWKLCEKGDQKKRC